MDLEKLKVFYQVAKHGSISGAALNLKIAQSAISRSISLLEEDLNTQLFIRPGGAKGVILTDSGQILFDSSKKILEIENLTTLAIEDYNKEPQGSLKVIASIGNVSVWLVDVLPGFLKLYPKMSFILEGYNDVAINLENSDADVAIAPFIHDASDLIQDYLVSYPLKLYASKEYLKEFGVPRTPQDLDHHRLIIFSTSRKSSLGNVDWHLNLGCSPQNTRKPFLQVNSSIGLKKAAEYGLGIIALNSNFPGMQESNLVEVLPEIEGYTIEIYYIYHKNFVNSKRITSFRDYLKKVIKNID